MFQKNRWVFTVSIGLSTFILFAIFFLVVPLYAEVPTPNAHWTFDEDSGDTTPDITGNSEDATLVNGPTRILGHTGEDGDKALSFSKTDQQWVDTPYFINGKNPINELSISFWMRTSLEGGASYPIIYANGNGVAFFHMGFGSRDGDWGCGSSQKVYIAIRDCGKCSETILNPGETWHHIVGIWNRGGETTVQTDQFTIYVDGVKSSSKFYCTGHSNVTDGFVATTDIEIATNSRWWASFSTAYFDGDLDDFRIYERALNADEVLGIFTENVTATISGPDTGYIGGTYQFSENTYSRILDGSETYEYEWSATGSATISTTNNIADIAWDYNTTTGVTQTVTMVITPAGGSPITDTHEIVLQPVPAPTIEGAKDGSPYVSYPFTATVLADLHTPFTYTWEISEQARRVITDTNQYSTTHSGSWSTIEPSRKYITVTVSNEYIGVITGTTSITITATRPNTGTLVGPSILAFGETGIYSVSVSPKDISRPFTYTWATETVTPVVKTMRDEGYAVISDTQDFAWDVPMPVPSKPVLHTVAVTIHNDWGVVTRTHTVTVTHRPLVVSDEASDSFTKVEPDSATQITKQDGEFTITMDEDETSGEIAFTIVDTDTLSTMNLDTHVNNVSGVLNLENNDITITSPQQNGTEYTSTIAITPPQDEWGEADITILASDGLVEGRITIHLVVNEVNDPPDFTKGNDIKIKEDAGKQVFLEWATDVQPGPYEQSQTVTFSTATSNPDLFAVEPSFVISDTSKPMSGTLSFTSAPNANGTAIVTATLKDDSGEDDNIKERSFTITVEQVNDVPIAHNDIITVTSGMPYIISNTLLLTNDEDVDLVVKEIDTDQELSVLKATDPERGTLILNDNDTITYTPPDNFQGSDVFTYTLSDGISITPTARVDVVILSPFAGDDTITTLEDTPLTNIGAKLLANDQQPNNAAFIAATSTTDQEGVVILEQGSISNTLEVGDISYTPPEDFFGTDTFTYTVTNEDMTDTATVTVTVKSVNDAPSFQRGADQMVSSSDGTQTVANWATNISPGPSNEVTQTLDFTLTNDNKTLFTAQPDITINGTNGTLTYTPAEDADGVAIVTTLLSDNGGTENGGVDEFTDTFTITLTRNAAPLANTNSFSTEQDTALTIGVATLLADDTDPNDDPITFVDVATTSQQGGSIEWQNDSTSMTYTPPSRFIGTDTFTYTITDGMIQTTGDIQVEVVKPSSYQTFLPIIIGPKKPDLTVSFSLDPENEVYAAGEAVTINVTVQNNGNLKAGPFWVDFFFNPMQTPTANTRWDVIYSDGYYYGIAWQVTDGLAPGESIVLTSAPGVPGGYDKQYTRNWNGYFLSGTTDLYVLVDNWNDAVDTTTGSVLEVAEDNNMAHRTISVIGANPLQLTMVSPDRLPVRTLPNR